MATAPSIKLNDGTSIPAIGFGTGTGLYRQDCSALVLSALKHGYRYLDSAQQYGNAESIKDALKQWDGKREDVYIVTKFGFDAEKGHHHDPRELLLAELKKLGVEYVDLYLIHSPLYATPNLQESWKVMESLVKEGLTKSIGVSNFAAEDIEEIKKVWTIPPVVNQIEFNPYLYHAPNMLRLRETLDANDIRIEAYGPLNSLFRSTGGPVDPIVERIAKEKNATTAQVLLAWAQQFTEGIVVTTSRNHQRQLEQLESLDKVKLSKTEVDEIAQAGKGRFFRQFMHNPWDRAKP